MSKTGRLPDGSLLFADKENNKENPPAPYEHPHTQSRASALQQKKPQKK